ncbi:hypothetical protein BJF87_24055 [Gordonia sp. CNJ-863]|nr:hypothetical protein BJF87_24055 [Gordonia sp. CNJ-863]
MTALVLLTALLWMRPRLSLIAWLLSVTMVPYWVGVSQIVGFVPLAAVLGATAVLSAYLQGWWTPRTIDYAVATFIAGGYLAVAFGGASRAVWLAWITHWLVGYLVARAVGGSCDRDFLVKSFAAVMSLVGLFSSIEFLLSWHPFVSWYMPNRSFALWHPIQPRGEFERSEWAFGHSISLGVCLAMALPFALSMKTSAWVKTTATLAIAAGCLLSLSRAGLLSLFVTLALYVVFSRRIVGWTKVLCLVFMAAFSVSIYDFVQAWIADEADATASTQYRVQMYRELIGSMSIVGQSDAAISVGDQIYFAGYRSIDSAFLFIGLAYGWLFPVVLLAGIAAVACYMIFGSAGSEKRPAAIAILGTVPALSTVTFITQYQILFWFIVGILVNQILGVGRSPNSASIGRSRLPSGPENEYAIGMAESTNGRTDE